MNRYGLQPPVFRMLLLVFALKIASQFSILLRLRSIKYLFETINYSYLPKLQGRMACLAMV